MGHAIELAHAQLIRLNNHLSESLEHTKENFFSMAEEAEVTAKILQTLAANHKDY